MKNIFDGIQRPLESIFNLAGKSIYIPRGINTPALDKNSEWFFEPLGLKVRLSPCLTRFRLVITSLAVTYLAK